MTQRLVSVGDDFKLPAPVKVDEPNLPARLSDAQLTATYAKADPAIAMVYGDPANPTLPTSVTEDGITTTFTYDGSGNPLTRTRNGVTRTFTYTAGNLTGVA